MTLPSLDDWLVPGWAPHSRVRALVTTRRGQHTPPPRHGFNLGANCGDDAARVEQARLHVHRLINTDHPPAWLEQVHGIDILDAELGGGRADGAWTRGTGRPCVVLTADCLPVLLARADGSAVAALHAGWRGLLNGILEAGVARLAPGGEEVSAWIGPAISQARYQVGDEVREHFVRCDDTAASAFVADSVPGRWRMSLARLAEARLAAAGVADISGGDYCTAAEETLFYSYRRDGTTGRFATLIWLTP